MELAGASSEGRVQAGGSHQRTAPSGKGLISHPQSIQCPPGSGSCTKPLKTQALPFISWVARAPRGYRAHKCVEGAQIKSAQAGTEPRARARAAAPGGLLKEAAAAGPAGEGEEPQWEQHPWDPDRAPGAPLWAITFHPFHLSLPAVVPQGSTEHSSIPAQCRRARRRLPAEQERQRSLICCIPSQLSCSCPGMQGHTPSPAQVPHIFPISCITESAPLPFTE